MLQFLDVETNPGPWYPVPAVCRILCSNVWGLARNLSDLTVPSSQYDILLCSKTLVSDTSHVSELLDLSFGGPGPEGWMHTYKMVMENFSNPNLSLVVAKCCCFEIVVRDRTIICSVFTETLTEMTRFLTVYLLHQ